MKIFAALIAFCCLLFGCKSKTLLQTDDLIINKISENVYQHISFLNSETFGKVDCNGMIIIDNGEAVIFDTTPDNVSSQKLINYVEQQLNAKVKAIVPTHFHADCLGGLQAFHDTNIPSYASLETIRLAEKNNLTVPRISIGNGTTIFVGNDSVRVKHFGEGHTKDNIVGYFAKEEALFGGCLIKEIGANKGNLEDANQQDWSKTVAKIKKEYPNLQHVIPGHGKPGNSALLDYTIELFKNQ